MNGDAQPASTIRGHLALTAFAVLVALVMLFSGLGSIPLMQPDEGRNAEVAREMAAAHSWLVPTLEGHVYLDKPAAYFAAVAVSLRVLGVNEWAARLPSAGCGLLILAMIYVFTRRYYDPAAAALAVIVIATSPLVFAFSRIVIMDVALGVFTVAAILAAFVAEAGPRPDRRWHAVAAAAVGGGLLVKGPVGLLVPAAVLVAFFLVERRPRALARVFSPVNALIALGLFVPWFVALTHAHHEFLRYGLIEETWKRFFTPAFNRGQPFWYYGPMMLESVLPWTLLAVPMAVAAWTRRAAFLSVDRLFIVWTLAVAVFFSLSRTKQPGYIFTGVVAAGALIGRGLSRGLHNRLGGFGRITIRGTMIYAALALAGAAWLSLLIARGAADPAHLAVLRPEQRALWPMWPWLLIVHLIIVGVGALAWLRRSVALSSVAFAVFPLALVTVLLPAVREFATVRSAKPLVAALKGVSPTAELASFEDYPAGLSFYLRHTITVISADASALRSNFILYQIRTSGVRPPTIVTRVDRGYYLASRTTPVVIFSPKSALPDLTAWLGPRASPQPAANDWWYVGVAAAKAP